MDEQIRIMKEEERVKILNEAVIKQEQRQPLDFYTDILANFMKK